MTLSPISPRSATAQNLTPHGPIYIRGDRGFNATNGVVSGSGLPQDPYVISGWNITATGGLSPASAVFIANTRAAFLIRDILVHTSSSSSDTYGVYIENAPGGVVDHVQITGPKYGVYVSLSPSFLIENNNVWNATWGIYLTSGSDNSRASNNIIHNATAAAITVSGNNALTINGNAVSCVGNCTGFFITATNSLFEGNSAANGPSCLGARLALCYGYRIVSTTDSVFRNNTILNNAFGFIINGADYRNLVQGNRAFGNQYGIGLEGGSGSVNTDNTVSENNVTNNNYGIYAFMSSQNRIFDNYLRNNTLGNANDASATDGNLWNIPKTLGTNILGGPFLGGNYYSDYTGTDGDGDGLGDTPHSFTGNLDQLPLVAAQPSAVHDIAVTRVNIQPSTSNSGSNFTIAVDLFNDGSTSENFTVYAYYNQTFIGANPITKMAAQTQTITSFTWTTIGVTAGNYNITARVPPLPGEIVTKNNNSSATLSLTPDKPPTAVFTANLLAVPVRTPVSFDASSSHDPDGKIVTYFWNFGDNSGTATGVMLTHTFSLAGNYTVTLTVRDNSGSLAMTTGVVSVSAIRPTAPQNLQLKSAKGVITLTWALGDNGGAPITQYRVYRGIDPNSLVFYKVVTGSATSFNDTSVSEGQVYYYQVTAVNSVGESPVSNRVSGPGNTQPQSQDNILLIASIAGIILGVLASLILLLRNRSKKVPVSTR